MENQLKTNENSGEQNLNNPTPENEQLQDLATKLETLYMEYSGFAGQLVFWLAIPTLGPVLLQFVLVKYHFPFPIHASFATLIYLGYHALGINQFLWVQRIKRNIGDVKTSKAQAFLNKKDSPAKIN